MDYDFRKGTQLRPQSGYDLQRSMYVQRTDRQGGPNSPSFYPRVAQPVGPPMHRPPPPVPGPASGTGIKVAIKPEYQVAPPVQLSPLKGEVPRSLFQFDFDLERRIIAEAERERHGWTRGSFDNSRPSDGGDSSVTSGIVEDPVVHKYVSKGLNKEAVVMALATYGDVQNKVVEFCPAYNLLREMGFPSDAVAGALAMYDNDKERALAHFV
ncbi:hypothetical protein O6H91_01G072400 [Diphasiastrum complanatum]|uniref:Uncharacterized protein n=1 Tax=Diphasiastrum complanatum TaxID=34168 RepID=A0ACC2ESH8_DIPCM|nr:hypothetical protein O6H91_01G072400 [Diphasiastrum complanatum]